MRLPTLIIAIGLPLLNGCGNGGNATKAADPDYSPILPVYILEEHPTLGGSDAHGISKKVESDTTLVIPLYEEVLIGGKAHPYAILNPFPIKSTDDLEAELTKRGNRNQLVRVILWVPGYLPVAIPSSFRPERTIDGKKMTHLQIHKENLDNGSPTRMARALTWLLTQDHFLLGGYVDTRRQYDPRSLVVAVEYGSQYSYKASLRGVKDTYVLWAFNSGTQIDIVLDAAAKKEALEILGKFDVEGVTEKQGTQASGDVVPSQPKDQPPPPAQKQP